MTPSSPSARAAAADVGSALLRHCARAYERAVRSGAARLSGDQRNAVLRLLTLRVTPAALAQLNREVDSLVDRWLRKAHGSGIHEEELVRFVLVLSPLTGSSSD